VISTVLRGLVLEATSPIIRSQ